MAAPLPTHGRRYPRPDQLAAFRRQQWRRAGRRLLVGYWAACIAVIVGGLAWTQPAGRAAVERLWTDPADSLPGPFVNCSAAHAAGVYDIPRSSPAYLEQQDGDGDGLACEPPPPQGTSGFGHRSRHCRFHS